MKTRRTDFDAASTARLMADLGPIRRDRSGFYSLGMRNYEKI